MHLSLNNVKKNADLDIRFDLFLPQKWPEIPPIFYFAKYMGFDDPTEPGTHINPNIHRDGLGQSTAQLHQSCVANY